MHVPPWLLAFVDPLVQHWDRTSSVWTHVHWLQLGQTRAIAIHLWRFPSFLGCNLFFHHRISFFLASNAPRELWSCETRPKRRYSWCLFQYITVPRNVGIRLTTCFIPPPFLWTTQTSFQSLHTGHAHWAKPKQQQAQATTQLTTFLAVPFICHHHTPPWPAPVCSHATPQSPWRLCRKWNLGPTSTTKKRWMPTHLT